MTRHARIDGLRLADGRYLAKGDCGYLQRLPRAVRASMGAGGYAPPEVKALIAVVINSVEDAA